MVLSLVHLKQWFSISVMRDVEENCDLWGNELGLGGREAKSRQKEGSEVSVLYHI